MSFLLVIGQTCSVLLVPFSAVLAKVPQSLFLRVTIHYNNHLLVLYSKRFCNERSLGVGPRLWDNTNNYGKS